MKLEEIKIYPFTVFCGDIDYDGVQRVYNWVRSSQEEPDRVMVVVFPEIESSLPPNERVSYLLNPIKLDEVAWEQVEHYRKTNRQTVLFTNSIDILCSLGISTVAWDFAEKYKDRKEAIEDILRPSAHLNPDEYGLYYVNKKSDDEISYTSIFDVEVNLPDLELMAQCNTKGNEMYDRLMALED